MPSATRATDPPPWWRTPCSTLRRPATLGGGRRQARRTPYLEHLRFDLDSLDHADWESLSAAEREPSGPSGATWSETASVLVKLVAWAGWGLYVAKTAAQDAPDASGLRFDLDSLAHADWETVRTVEEDLYGPDRLPWSPGTNHAGTTGGMGVARAPPG